MARVMTDGGRYLADRLIEAELGLPYDGDDARRAWCALLSAGN